MKKLRTIILLVGVLVLAGCSSNLKSGVTMLADKQYEEAISYFEQDIKKDRNLDEAYRGIGIAQYELGLYKEAVESFDKAIKNGAQETATMDEMIATCYLQLDDYEEALTYYEKALKQEDCTAAMKQEILYNEIAIYELQGEWETLKERVPEYMEAYPDDSRMEKTAEFLETR